MNSSTLPLLITEESRFPNNSIITSSEENNLFVPIYSNQPQEANHWYIHPSIQSINTSTLLNQSFNVNDGSFSFIENIWAEELGSGSYQASDYETGVVDPLQNYGLGVTGSLNASVFTRIGNTEYGSDLNETLNDDVEKLSAGWRFNFSITDDYEYINVSFWWRFDAMNGIFDDYRSNPELEYLDPSPDYQEIRCKITPPTGTNQSFWLGDATTPNKTVFYRVGPNITKDETWFLSSYLFYVDKDLSSDFQLELGAFMNTREYFNEYFDVWFDNILIQGVSNSSDTYPPITTSYGLARTETDNTRYQFWTNFSIGYWESSIANVTVYYNLTRDLNTTFKNASLDEDPYYNVENSGYLQTRWNYTTTFNFSDILAYKFVVFDEANNSFTSPVQGVIIGDFVAPRITSNTNTSHSSFIRQSGNGSLEIRVNVTDWGYGVDQVVLNYSIDGTNKPLIAMSEIGMFTENGLVINQFSTNISVDYGTLISFDFFLNDTVGNFDYDKGYSVLSNIDIINPSLTAFNIYPDDTLEGKTHVEVGASDPFGELSGVFLSIQQENEPVMNFSLRYDNESQYYIPRTPGGLLDLSFDPTNPSITLTALVRDKSGLEDFNSSVYVVRDIVAPQILTGAITMEYLYPGSLRVWVSARDDGSGLANVSLSRKKGSDWTDLKIMRQKSEGVYYLDLSTNIIGNQPISFRIEVNDQVGNVNIEEIQYVVPIFVTTTIGLFITLLVTVLLISAMFTSVKVIKKRRVRTVRRRRFDVAVRRSERLAYLGEEAMFGFMAAYGQGEGITSVLIWEPQFIGHFYQYLKELSDRANNAVDFVMQTKAQDIVTYVDFSIEQIGCTAITFAFPVANLPQKWLSALSLDQTPISTHQGVLMMMLLMREKWSEVSHSFQEEISEGMQEIKDYILAGEDKDIINQKIQEFRLFISGTIEIMEEIEDDDEDVTDSIMGDFDSGSDSLP
ncbi:MAG: hypothetical protein ACXAB7_00025 [Candidatus Kariarchaeaceae archaeon]